jgi:hypothetical protein
MLFGTVNRERRTSVSSGSAARPTCPSAKVNGFSFPPRGGQRLWDIPVDQWFHLRIDYRFGDTDKDSTYRLRVTRPDGRTQTADLTVAKPWYTRTAY